MVTTLTSGLEVVFTISFYGWHIWGEDTFRIGVGRTLSYYAPDILGYDWSIYPEFIFSNSWQIYQSRPEDWSSRHQEVGPPKTCVSKGLWVWVSDQVVQCGDKEQGSWSWAVSVTTTYQLWSFGSFLLIFLPQFSTWENGHFTHIYLHSCHRLMYRKQLEHYLAVGKGVC